MDSGDDTIAATDGTPSEGVGAMLRARRLELGLSQADVASMVKLHARRIEAMEQERWEELPDGPFLRGFLRNIARALNLDGASLMARVDESLMRTGSPDTILVPQSAPHGMLPMRSGPADDRRGGRALVYGAFLFALIAAVIAWSGTASFDRAVLAAKRMIEPSAPVVNPVSAPLSERTVGPEAPSAAPVPTAGEPAPTQGLTAFSPEAAKPATSAGELSLLFHFNEASWVEVRSADGKVLLQQLNAAGSDQKINGEAPFTIVVGNAKGVAVMFRGQPVDLTPYTRDSVARLKLS